MITGIIMASGFSERMGKDKLLLEIDGMKMVERVIRACVNSSLDRTILVYRKEEVKRIGEKYRIETIYNPNAHLGQSESMKLGIRKALYSRAYMFLVGDQPFINSMLIDRLIEEFEKQEHSIIVPSYNGRNGTPTIFSSKHRDELLRVEGDKGGRDVLKANIDSVKWVYIEDERLGMDMDSFEDLEGVIL